MFLSRRHGAGHYANVRYGYIALALSGLHYLLLVLAARWNWRRFAQRKGPVSLSVLVQIIAWAILVTALCSNLFVEFQEHSSTLLKRLGRLGYTLVTLDVLIVLRPNLMNYLPLVALHKWLSRFIVLLGSLHSVGFLVKWLVAGTLSKAFRLWNFLGMVLFAAFIPLIILSTRYYRKRNYKLFYLTHNLVVVLFVVLATLHARPGVTPLTVVNVALLVFQLVLKFNYVSVKCSALEEFDSFHLVSFEPPFPVTTAPGSHIRINSSGILSFFLPSHPYTIIYYDNKINLVINRRNAFYINSSDYFSMSYPYNAFLFLKNYEHQNVTVVVGGSGISFALSILAQYPHKLDIIWCVKNRKDLGVLNHFNLDYSTLRVFITQNDEEESAPLNNIELEEFNTKFPTNFGRPQLPAVLQPEPDLLIACGPASLVRDCEMFARQNNVMFVKESYQM